MKKLRVDRKSLVWGNIFLVLYILCALLRVVVSVSDEYDFIFLIFLVSMWSFDRDRVDAKCLFHNWVEPNDDDAGRLWARVVKRFRGLNKVVCPEARCAHTNILREMPLQQTQQHESPTIPKRVEIAGSTR